ncbi:small integral membrane protein 30-like [Rhinatrema bivittatum]|uniref:small integral membrane protein 30-like n=1 Tax=Rhinatrema bivittatum TaxID=194408 RepID=UPI00112809D2|nr:small integral membrane protein 30-like [Rhinatrema bivittatum]XP_029468580.1 small integral membrane protein 30-like [Rhinatrema bivittatum]
MPGLKHISGFLLAFLTLLCLLPTAEAMDGGDAVAVLLGVTISIFGFCVCLGYYARKRNDQL